MKMVAEVAFIRPILIILLVVYHAFIIYAGGWSQPVGYVDVPFYKNIAVVSYSSMLETFVFISGYLFFWGIIKANKSVQLKSVIKSKFRRLLIPAWVWSILYFFLVDNSNSLEQISLQGGVIGHMWFLPMLFWCFVIGWLFFNIKGNPIIKLLLSLLLSIFSRLPLPFFLSEAFYYQFFFILSYFLVTKREAILKFLSGNCLIVSWMLNIVILFLYIIYGDQINTLLPHDSLKEKLIFYSIRNFQKIIVSFSGVFTLYMTAYFCVERKQLSKGIIDIGTCCFGIYIFQQFILKILYFQTSLPEMVGCYWLPWLSVVITLILSWVITVVLRKYRIFKEIL